MDALSERPASAPVGPRPGLRLRARPGQPPLGAALGLAGLVAGAAVVLLHLDRLPIVLCTFKAFTGLPCPTCGSTRALARLFSFDPAGALAMNPLATLGAVGVGVWALLDVALLTRRRALALEVHPRLASALRWGALVLFLANWVYLLAVRR